MSQENKHLSLYITAKTSSKLAGALLILQLVLVPTANAVEVFTAQELASCGERYQTAGFASFWLGDPLPLRNVANVVADIAALQNLNIKNETSMAITSKSLLNNYPCKI